MSLEVRGQCPLLQVYDMEESLRFWRDLLGFKVVQRAGPENDTGWAWLRRGTAEIMLNTMYETPDRPAVRDKARHQAHGDTCVYFGCPDIDGMYAELTAGGVAAH